MKKAFVLVLIVIAFGGLVKSGMAAPKTHKLHYVVYAGGINAVTATLDLDLRKTTYDLALKGETRGFLKALAPWTGSFATQGWRSDTAYFPRLHTSKSGWKTEQDIKEYRYDRKRNFLGLKHTEDGHDKSPQTIDPALTKGTTDILSATLAVMSAVAYDKPCAGQADVFDGKRRFAAIFKDQGAVTLKESAQAIYAGPARMCTLEIKPKGGKWGKKPRGWLALQEQGRQSGTMPTLWMANVPGVPVAVPVKIRVKTKYGTLFMHLADW